MNFRDIAPFIPHNRSFTIVLIYLYFFSLEKYPTPFSGSKEVKIFLIVFESDAINSTSASEPRVNPAAEAWRDPHVILYISLSLLPAAGNLAQRV